MKLNINGEIIDIPPTLEDKLLSQFEEKVLEMVEKLPAALKLAIKVFAREELKKMEDKARPILGVERAKVFRPAKGVSPVVHLAGFMRAKLEDGLVSAIGTIEYSEDHQITALNFSVPHKGSTGRQTASHGDEREREDDGAEIS